MGPYVEFYGILTMMKKKKKKKCQEKNVCTLGLVNKLRLKVYLNSGFLRSIRLFSFVFKLNSKQIYMI